MITTRRSADRFHGQLDWLESRHSFSFGQHYDPAHVGHGPLRVINEDWIAPRSGFPDHPHQDMEILTYMLSGTLTHRDSEGNAVEIRPGRIQRMRAGRGIVHSEMNLSADEPAHLLQIWIEPDRPGLTPGHDELAFALAPGESRLLLSPDGAEGSLGIAQDARVTAMRPAAGSGVELPFQRARRGWVQIAHGEGELAGLPYEAGDGFAIEGEGTLALTASRESEVLVFDLP